MFLTETVNLKDVSTTLWFDERDHIAIAAKSLKSFNELVKIRSQYGSFAAAPMHDYVVGGIWNLDHFGQIGIRTLDNYRQELPPLVKVWLDEARKFMLVYTKNEFQNTLDNLDFKGSLGHAFGGSNHLPDEHEECCICNMKWEPQDSDDCHRKGRPLSRGLAPSLAKMFIGRTMAEINEAGLRNDGSRLYLDRVNPFKNPKFIDLTEKEEHGRTRQENAEGWMSTHYSDNDKAYHIDPKTYKMQDGDEPIFEYQPVAHAACYKKALTQDVKEKILNAFKEALVEVTGIIPINNQYEQGMYSASWYLITSAKGTFRVGWRRRVISLIEMQSEENYAHLVFDKKSEDVHFDTYSDMAKHLKEKE